jgi:hypothetical protein
MQVGKRRCYIEALPAIADSRRLELELNFAAECGGDIDEGVEGEAVDAATQKIIEAGLANATALCCLYLRPATILDDLVNLHHQFGTGGEIRRLLGSVAEGVPDVCKLLILSLLDRRLHGALSPI